MRVLIVIPARGGSKRLPGKNLLTVCGASLVARAIVTAREFAGRADRCSADIVVDTDSPEVADEARRWGAAVPFLRPPELSGDTTSTAESVEFFLKRVAGKSPPIAAVVLLQPTSPLRRADDVARCWAEFDPAARPSVISVTGAREGAEPPLHLDEDGTLRRARRNTPPGSSWQGGGPTYCANGAVYITTPAFLHQHRALAVPGCTRGVPMAAERSIDIDTAADLALADALLARTATAGVRIGDRQIGGNASCFIIAEAGINHNGDLDLAHRLVDAAAEAGVDAVKFQTFDPARVVSHRDAAQIAMGRQLALTPEAFEQLHAHACVRRLLFLSSPFDAGSADFLDQLGVPAFKIPSGEITNPPFLAHVANKGKPLLISTGMATLREVADAVDVVRANGSPPLAVLHCVSNYPAAPEECNLRAMGTMRSLFHAPVGWSDHTPGINLGIAAVAMGAALLEKHVTLDRSLPGPDHQASLEPGELASLVRGVREAEAALGDGVKAPVETELSVARRVRRSVHAARDLEAGEILAPSDLVLLRPGSGIPASQAAPLVGRRLRARVSAGVLLCEADFE